MEENTQRRIRHMYTGRSPLVAIMHHLARTHTHTYRQTPTAHAARRGNIPSVRLRPGARLGLALKPRRSWHERCRAAGCHGSWFDRPLTARETSAHTTEAPIRTSAPKSSSTSPTAKHLMPLAHEATAGNPDSFGCLRLAYCNLRLRMPTHAKGVP